MATINLKKREVEFKIVYYGPGRCGKTTNLEYIFKNSRRHMLDEMVSIKTAGDLTLFFDFVPMGLGTIKGCEVRVQLYTVPGQTKYATTRKLVLKGADGVVFVADSMRVRHEQNIESLRDLSQNLKDYGMTIFRFPVVMQWNKRDLAVVGVPLMSIEEMDRFYNRQLKAPAFEASAVSGAGVNNTLKAALVLTLKSIKEQAGWE
jgi:signal recognition particle receptor subunit beta